MPSRPSAASGGAEVLRVDLEDRPVALDDEVVHAGEAVQPGGGRRELGRDGRTREVPQLGQRAGLDGAARRG